MSNNQSSTREGATAEQAAPTGGPIFTAHDGAVWRRGVYVPPELCGSLLDHLRSARPETDWQAALNQRLARELESAMAEAYHMDIAA